MKSIFRLFAQPLKGILSHIPAVNEKYNFIYLDNFFSVTALRDSF